MSTGPTIVRSAVSTVMGLVVCASALAAPIRIDFGGQLTRAPDASFGSGTLIEDAPFSIDERFSGYLVYESSTPPSYFGATTSFHRNALTEFVVNIGSLGQISFNQTLITNSVRQYTYATVGNAGTPRFSAGAANDLQSGFTGQAFESQQGLIDFDSSASQPLTNWSLAGASINTIAGQALNVGHLPVPSSIDELSNGRGGNLNLQYWSAWTNPENGQYRHGIFTVSGRITEMSLAPTTVPEPNTLGLFVLGLLLLRRSFGRFTQQPNGCAASC